MKKKLVPVLAALGAAFAAQAADVTIYGAMSTGGVLTHTKGVSENANQSTTGFTMESAWAGDSVWGITAQEDLANGFRAGVALESEYASDTGELADEKIFGSMSYLWVGNDTVKVSIGNLGGGLTSGGGDFDLIGGFDPLEAAYGLGGMGLVATKDMAPDSALALEVTPLEGLKVSLQASAGDKDIPKWSDRDHYYGVGLLYENGPFAGTLAFETERRAPGSAAGRNGTYYSVGLSWDAEYVKPMVIYQHAKNASLRSFADGALDAHFEAIGLDDAPARTDSVVFGASAPLAGGTVAVAGQYARVKSSEMNLTGKAYTVGVSYTYEFSKRTSLYTGAVLVKGKKDFAEREALNGYQVGLGINHTF